MLSQKMQDALNTHINAEIYSAYIYYSMAAYFEDQSLSGCAHWMRIQTMEELSHVQKFVDYMTERGGRVLMQPVAGPATEWESPLAAFEETYKHETQVTALINRLVDLAIEESDHATNNFLQWFVSEQVEEEASADDIVQKMRLVESAPGGLFMLDRELSQRPLPTPAGLTGGE
jgi:ferritin